MKTSDVYWFKNHLYKYSYKLGYYSISIFRYSWFISIIHYCYYSYLTNWGPILYPTAWVNLGQSNPLSFTEFPLQTGATVSQLWGRGYRMTSPFVGHFGTPMKCRCFALFYPHDFDEHC